MREWARILACLYIFVALCILVFIGALSLFFLVWLEAYGPVMIWP